MNYDFPKMVHSDALQKASPYLDEEAAVLEDLLKSHKTTASMTFCLIGGGTYHYFDLATQYTKKYFLIEPFPPRNSPVHVDQKRVTLFPGTFEKYCTETLERRGNTIYVFWFNVVRYIENLVSSINQIVKEGDILFFSEWNETEKAEQVRTEYVNYVGTLPRRVNRSFELSQIPLAKKVEITQKEVVVCTTLFI